MPRLAWIARSSTAPMPPRERPPARAHELLLASEIRGGGRYWYWCQGRKLRVADLEADELVLTAELPLPARSLDVADSGMIAAAMSTELRLIDLTRDEGDARRTRSFECDDPANVFFVRGGRGLVLMFEASDEEVEFPREHLTYVLGLRDGFIRELACFPDEIGGLYSWLRELDGHILTARHELIGFDEAWEAAFPEPPAADGRIDLSWSEW